MSVKVKALQAGFYGGARRRPGQVFEIKDDDKPGRWMEVLSAADEAKEEAKPRGRKPRGDGPQTFADITKQDVAALTPKGLESEQ